MTYREAQEKALTVLWVTELCESQGEKCWCRIIRPIEPIKFETDQVEDEIDCIVTAGSISRIYAEHFVALHNSQLIK